MAEEPEYKLDPNASERDLLFRILRELVTIRQGMGKVLLAVADAESEIPEKLRRFMNYMHDVHDVKYMYEELGQPVPIHLNKELERLDDRYRQILTSMKAEGGAINKVIREMADDPLNRWDHTKQLPKPKENANEARPSENVDGGSDQDGADLERGEP